jgi:serine/threonine-protein kinase
VYVQPFQDTTGGLWPVSTAGGSEPLWSRDGQELFYRSASGAVMSVPVSSGATWVPSVPRQLVEPRPYALGTYRTYDVSPDGKRFLMIKRSEASSQTSTAPRIVVVQNWINDLTRAVPTK